MSVGRPSNGSGVQGVIFAANHGAMEGEARKTPVLSSMERGRKKISAGGTELEEAKILGGS